jgi:hypothetical protein
VDADAKAMLPLASAGTLDGGRLLDEIASGAHATRVDGFPGLTTAQRADLKQAGADLAQWFGRLYAQPAASGDDAWAPRFLEYQFACAAEAQGVPQTVLTAGEYTTGHLDWYSFDVDERPEARLLRGDGTVPELPAPVEAPLSFLPAPVSFGGMPSPRYWEMEDRKTEFADLDANTTDVAKLLLTEFALVFGNDWCVIPYEVEVGSVCEVLALLVTDDFGEQTLVRAAGRGVDDDWQRWTMFTLSANRADGRADTRLFLPPALTKVMEGALLEKTHLLRDEMANMAWGVERLIENALEQPLNRYEASNASSSQPTVPANGTPVYRLASQVPDYWTPLLPVQTDAATLAIRLVRGAVLKPDGSQQVVKSRGRILDPDNKTPFALHEEEVPREGARVARNYQLARWLDGSTHLWMGRRKQVGRGEGSSGLRFDTAEER